MKTTNYLYDIEPSILKGLEYETALKVKLNAGKDLLSRLVQVHYDLRDDERVYEVYKAIRHTEKLLEELK